MYFPVVLLFLNSEEQFPRKGSSHKHTYNEGSPMNLSRFLKLL
jgi:hypothetical protein